MKSSILHLSILALIFGFNYSVYSQPIPLGESKFPKPNDSIRFRTNIISPFPSFKDTVKKNDSLSIDKSLYKTLESLGDEDMKNIATNNGPNKTWDVVTFFYNNSDSKVGSRTYRTPTIYVAGSSSFPSSNLYYSLSVTTSSSTIKNNVFLKKDATGLYELGTRVLQSPPYNLVNNVPKPIILFPLDYNNPKNIDNKHIITTSTSPNPMDSKTLLNVTVDGWGTLNVITGSETDPKTKTYNNCFRTVTHSIDTMVMEPFHFYVESKIYNWYHDTMPEAIVTFSYAKVRNDIDPGLWIFDPMLAWHDECDMSYVTFAGTVGIDENEINNDLIKVFPNPSSGTFNVMIDKIFKNFNNIEVSDMLGNVIYSKEISLSDNGMILVDISDRAKGLYFLKINSDDSSVTRKILIK